MQTLIGVFILKYKNTRKCIPKKNAVANQTI